MSLHKRLYATGTLLATLVDSEAYPYFRASDRYGVSLLQRRISEFLRQPQAEEAVLNTVHRDFEACVERLASVNFRQQLRQRDGAVMREWLWERHRRSSQWYEPPRDLLHQRRQLLGLDPRLDRVLVRRLKMERMALVAVLEGLLVGSQRAVGELPTRPSSSVQPSGDALGR